MKEYSRIYEYMIKFLNMQIYVYARTNDEQSASARYIIIRERLFMYMCNTTISLIRCHNAYLTIFPIGTNNSRHCCITKL